jgi:hypothetical protein
MKPRQDQDQVTAAVAAAIAALKPAVTGGAFEGASKQAVWVEHERLAEMERPQLEIWLNEVVRQKLQAGEDLPRPLQLYLASLALNKSKGGRPVNFSVRDSAIYNVVTATIKRGFHLERNIASCDRDSTKSASSIVATALSELGITLSEKNVARIWRDIDKMRSAS